MKTTIYPCKELALKIQTAAANDAAVFFAKTKRKPTLAVVLVGADPASEVYVRKKGETCKQFGLESLDFHLKPELGFAALKELIQKLNHDDAVDGILVQSPLPKGWDERAIQKQISPAKDVDGFHPENAGELFIDAKAALAQGLPPCTPAGVMEVLKENKIELKGKHAVVVGRSTIVGKPMAHMLLAADATVTICHSRTENLAEVCRSADILVAGAGKKHLITRDHVKAGAVLIDVGIHRTQDANGKTKLTGDIDSAAVEGVAAFLTPVPNGIGPMTIAMLIRNTVRAATLRHRAANA